MQAPSVSLARCKVLVVEDEPIQALDLACSLQLLGCAVLGPVPSRARARDVLDRVRPNVVLLDMVLEDGVALPLARELVAANLTFAAVTGWEHLLQGDSLVQGVPTLCKPYTPAELRASVRALYRADLAKRLAEVEGRIAQSWANIKGQARIICQRATKGQDTRLGEELLQVYEQTLTILESRRNYLVELLETQALSRLDAEPHLASPICTKRTT